MIPVGGQVGPQTLGTGAIVPFRMIATGDMAISEVHGRFYEQTYRGNVFVGGISTLTAIANATYTTATLGATVTPIAGIYNPIGSLVNCVVLQATLALTVTAGTATGPGPFVWATSVTTVAVTTGNSPLNRKTLQPSGSAAKDISNVAPTGMSPNLTLRFGSALSGGLIKNISSVETAVGQNIGYSGVSIENFDGSFFVPPGGVIALLSTTTAVAHSAVSSIMWEEVPV